MTEGLNETHFQKIPDQAEYDIRFSLLTDEPFLKNLILDPDTRQWYPPSSDSDVDGFVRNWIGFSRYKSSLTATYKSEPIGIITLFLMPYIKVAHLCMIYLVVKPGFRRKGVGESLIKNALHLAKTRFKLESVHLEVFGDACFVMPLLRKFGFNEVVRQDKFVKFHDHFEPRIIMEKEL